MRENLEIKIENTQQIWHPCISRATATIPACINKKIKKNMAIVWLPSTKKKRKKLGPIGKKQLVAP